MILANSDSNCKYNIEKIIWITKAGNFDFSGGATFNMQVIR